MIADVISNFAPAMMRADETRLWRALISRIHVLLVLEKSGRFSSPAGRYNSRLKSGRLPGNPGGLTTLDMKGYCLSQNRTCEILASKNLKEIWYFTGKVAPMNISFFPLEYPLW